MNDYWTAAISASKAIVAEMNGCILNISLRVGIVDPPKAAQTDLETE